MPWNSTRPVLIGIAIAVASCAGNVDQSASSTTPPAGPRRPQTTVPIFCQTPAIALSYTAEFTPGSSKVGVDILHVTFTRKKPTPEETERVLRWCIDVMVKAVRVDYGTLVTAWYDEKPLTIPDGSTSMAFDPKTDMVRTWSERERGTAVGTRSERENSMAPVPK